MDKLIDIIACAIALPSVLCMLTEVDGHLSWLNVAGVAGLGIVALLANYQESRKGSCKNQEN